MCQVCHHTNYPLRFNHNIFIQLHTKIQTIEVQQRLAGTFPLPFALPIQLFYTLLDTISIQVVL